MKKTSFKATHSLICTSKSTILAVFNHLHRFFTHPHHYLTNLSLPHLKSLFTPKFLFLTPKTPILTLFQPLKALSNQPKLSISQTWHLNCQTANLPQEIRSWI